MTNLFSTRLYHELGVMLLLCLQLSAVSAIAQVQNQGATSPPKEPIEYLEAVDMLKNASVEELKSFNYYRLRFLLFISHRMVAEEITLGEDIKSSLKRALESNDYPGIVIATEKILEEDFTDIRAHKLKAVAHMKLNETDKANYHRMIALGLVRSIAQSGDGDSMQTAWHVFQVKEEYETVKMLGFFKRISQSVLIDHHRSYDVLKMENDNGEIRSFYFDVTEILERTQELMMQDKPRK